MNHTTFVCRALGFVWLRAVHSLLRALHCLPPGLPPLCAPVTVREAEEKRREDGHWLHCSCKEGFGVLCAFQSVAQWAKMSGAKEAVCVCQWGRGEVRAARGAERHRNRE